MVPSALSHLQGSSTSFCVLSKRLTGNNAHESLHRVLPARATRGPVSLRVGEELLTSGGSSFPQRPRGFSAGRHGCAAFGFVKVVGLDPTADLWEN